MMGSKLGAVAAIALLLTAAIPGAQGQEAPVVLLGIDASGAVELAREGSNAPLASFWVGDWIADSGWGGVESMLKASKASGRTPVLYWYYWGDSISPSCVENGCNGRNKAEWNSLHDGLVSRIRDLMGGALVYVVLENEFNKGGITDSAYAPTFDAYLEEKALSLKAVDGVKVVLGYGSWGEGSWGKFPRAIAASDAIGFQIMRAKTRDTEAFYRASPDKIASVLDTIQTLSPGKGAFLYDLALSSYDSSAWATAQKETLEAILARRAEFAAEGLLGIVYRTVRDNPEMSPTNYYGYAEQHWGLKESDGDAKASLAVWTDAFDDAAPTPPTPSTPPTPPPPAPAIPGAFEGEAMAATKGGRANDATASGGALWNLWSNGELSQLVSSSGGTFRVSIAARGQLAGGVAPVMELRVDGVTVASWSVGAALAAHTADVAFPSGDSRLSIAFVNDAIVGSEDRNLLVDRVGVAALPANQAPVAAFDLSGSHLSWTFDARASSDPDGDPLTFAWSFGATDAQVARDFAPGEHTVTLTVTDASGASASVSRTFTATQPNRAPTAAFDVSGAGLSWTFDASASSDPDGDPLTYAWSFGASGAQARADFPPGEHTVTLTVTDASGASASASRTFTATQPNRAPIASVVASGANDTWTFDASGSSDPDGDPLAYAWTFPDGTTATGARVTRTFSAGAQTVRLVVADPAGLADDANATVTSVVPAFTASFGSVKGNDWWVEVKVGANKPLSGVCALVDGACRPLVLKSWGAWAASFYVKPGTDVSFRASSGGESVASGLYDWPSATPVTAASAPPKVTFTPYDGNTYWVQTKVVSSATVKAVCASLNGDACKALTWRSWGAWAASLYAPTGTKVVFTATLSDGTTVKSGTYTWPVR